MQKALWKPIVKWTLLSLLTLVIIVFIGVGVVVNFIYTPSKLTSIVEETVVELLNADVKFESIEMTFFSTFPNFGLEVSDAAIISRVSRDSTQTDILLTHDSLISVKSGLMTISPIAYLIKNKIAIKLFTEDLLLWQKGELLTKPLKLDVDAEMKINSDSLFYTLKNAVVDINGACFDAAGTLKGDSVNRTLMVDLKYGIHVASLKTILNFVPNSVLKETDDVNVRGVVDCKGNIYGLYSSEHFPLITSRLSIKDGYIAYPELPSQIDTLEMDLYIMMDLEKEQESYVDLRHLYVKGGGIDVKFKGGVKDILLDPFANVDLRGSVNIEDMKTIFPLADDMIYKGMLDSLFSMLHAFSGTVDFHIAVDALLDSAMMIDLNTLRGDAYLDGCDLVLMDGETFSEISKMLMFKNKEHNLIDTVSVNMSVRNGLVEIYPFLVSIDRYKVAISGVHNVDMTFEYHVSVLESPLPFRTGLDISGSFDKTKYRITKAKHKDLFTSSRRRKMDDSELYLQKQIREILENN